MNSKILAAAAIVVFVAAFAALQFAGIGLTGFGSLQSQGSEKIKIGVIGPLTGDCAKYGVDVKKGIELAATEINEAGGINRRELELIFEDSVCEPRKGVTALQKLINADGISIVIDAAGSSVALAEAPVAESSRVLLMLASASNYKIKYAGDYVFRVFPSDSFQGKKLVEIVKSAGHKRVALIYINNDYGVGLKEVFEEEFEKAGGEVIAAETHAMGETDFRPLLTKIANKKPDAIVFADYYKEGALAIKQIKELGINAALYGSEALKEEALIETAGNSAENLVLLFARPQENQAFKEFEAAYEEKFGEEPQTYAPYGYDAMQLLAQAIGKAGTDATKVKEELYRVKAYEGVTGQIEFDEFGERKSAHYLVFIVKQGEFVPFE